MKFMFSQSLVQVPVKYVSVQCRGGLITVLYGITNMTYILKCDFVRSVATQVPCQVQLSRSAAAQLYHPAERLVPES